MNFTLEASSMYLELNDTTAGAGSMNSQFIEPAGGVQYRNKYIVWILLMNT